MALFAPTIACGEVLLGEEGTLCGGHTWPWAVRYLSVLDALANSLWELWHRRPIDLDPDVVIFCGRASWNPADSGSVPGASPQATSGCQPIPFPDSPGASPFNPPRPRTAIFPRNAPPFSTGLNNASGPTRRHRSARPKDAAKWPTATRRTPRPLAAK